MLLRATFRPAESLAETLIAVTVIGLCTVTAVALLRSGIDQSAALSRKVIAENLAQEGMEALYNIRDTNYLRHAGDPENCWDSYDTIVGQSCTTHLVAGGTYALKRQFEDTDVPIFSWDLDLVNSPQDPDRFLNLYDVTVPGMTESMQMYAQSGVTAGPIVIVTLEDSAFERVVTIDSKDANSYTATVSVYYTVGGVSHHVFAHDTIQNTF